MKKEDKFTRDMAFELIARCLSNKDDNPECDGATESFRNIRHADFTTTTVDKYELNIGSVKIMHKYSCTDNHDKWDGEFAAYVVFTFDKGYGLATHTGWWGPTFSGDTWVLDVYESHDFSIFDKTCLTDDIRADLKELFDKEARNILLNDKEPFADSELNKQGDCNE